VSRAADQALGTVTFAAFCSPPRSCSQPGALRESGEHRVDDSVAVTAVALLVLLAGAGGRRCGQGRRFPARPRGRLPGRRQGLAVLPGHGL